MSAHAIPPFSQFQTLAAPGAAVPVYRTLLADHLTPVTAYERLATRGEHSFLLESVVGGERIARYSFLGSSPKTIIRAAGNNVTLEHRNGATVTNTRTFTSPDPLRELEALLRSTHGVKLPNLPSFFGGAVGYAGYDTVRYLEPEKLAAVPRDDRHLPDMLFGIYDELVIFDHVQKTIIVVATANIPPAGPSEFRIQNSELESLYRAAIQRVEAIIETLQQPVPFTLGSIDLGEELRPQYETNMTQAQYEAAVVAAKEYIKAGDIFQVVLSQRLKATTTARPFDIYRALRVVNPSPFMFYLASPEVTLVGASPEIMCRVQDGVITNRPLAGTRRRGKDDEEDRALEAELLTDPKERAEHIMLVDLGRNDVGRAAELGSVQVSDCMIVERYSHVMHIVSNVTGKLAADKTVFDALRLALPVGTVSGAPKIRAMQIIDELEPTRRGPYAGAIGYIDYAGNLDTCIGLRTMVVVPTPPSALVVQGSKPAPAPPIYTVYVQAGAGIVADSIPASEYAECINKASALLKAVAIAERGLAT